MNQIAGRKAYMSEVFFFSFVITLNELYALTATSMFLMFLDKMNEGFSILMFHNNFVNYLFCFVMCLAFTKERTRSIIVAQA